MTRTFYMVVFVFAVFTLVDVASLFSNNPSEYDNTNSYNVLSSDKKLPQLTLDVEINKVLDSFKLARKKVTNKQSTEPNASVSSELDERKLLLDNIAIELKAIVNVQQFKTVMPKAIITIEKLDDKSKHTRILTVGDSFDGYIISEISKRAITLIAQNKKLQQKVPHWTLELYKSNENHE